MNDDTAETILRYARDAGAVIKCTSCGEYEVSAGNADADRMVYAQVTNAWKLGNFGPLATRQEMMSVTKSVLQDVGDCPRCSRF
jgi:hypothetical protein